MAARAHGWQPDNPKIAKIPVAVAKEYNAADTGKKRSALPKHSRAKPHHLARALMGSGY
jgi:hypothetical protein